MLRLAAAVTAFALLLSHSGRAGVVCETCPATARCPLDGGIGHYSYSEYDASSHQRICHYEHGYDKFEVAVNCSDEQPPS